MQKNNKSGYKGVCWDTKKRKWKSQIGVEGKNMQLGYFTDKNEAALAYKKMSIKHYGEFSTFNSIKGEI